MGVTIVQANCDDLFRLAELGRQTYTEHFASLWHPAGLKTYLDFHFNPEKLRQELTSNNAVRYYLAHDDNEPLGFAKVKLEQPLPVEPRQMGLELEKIYFLQRAVGKGYGSILMQYLFALGRELQAPFVWLDVLKSNTRGKALYEKHGFVRVGEITFGMDGQKLGMWVMHRFL